VEVIDGLAAPSADVRHDPAVANNRPSSGPCSSVRSATEAMWSRGTTRMCVGARGTMSRKATTRSSSWTFVDGIVPATILQNRQSASVGIRGSDDSIRDGWVDADDADALDAVLEG
jgi:hypothetical protein